MIIVDPLSFVLLGKPHVQTTLILPSSINIAPSPLLPLKYVPCRCHMQCYYRTVVLSALKVSKHLCIFNLVPPYHFSIAPIFKSHMTCRKCKTFLLWNLLLQRESNTFTLTMVQQHTAADCSSLSTDASGIKLSWNAVSSFTVKSPTDRQMPGKA